MSKIVFTPERIEDHLYWLEQYIRDRRDIVDSCPELFIDLHFLDTIHSMLVDYEDYVTRFESIHFNDIGG